MHTFSPPDLERAFFGADPAFDGRFVAAVRTTGIFCRPSCRGRKPKPENVVYLATPSEARDAGYRPCLRCHPEAARSVSVRPVETPLGTMLAGATDAGLCLLEFADRRMLPAQLASLRRRIGPVELGSHRYLDQVQRELGEYFGGTRRDFGVPLYTPGSRFQERVWAEVRRIPYGAIVTYRQLAAAVGTPAAQRAVGRANGSNRLAIVIPCHRVVAARGGLGGYGGGLARKRALLDLEAAAA